MGSPLTGAHAASERANCSGWWESLVTSAAFPHELSGGTRQRVMIAMALALQPEVLILDEPTTALDVVTQRQIIQEVYAIQERFGMSVIFVTHDLALLLEIADRIAVMYAGKIVEVAANSELLANPAHPYSDALLASFPTLYGGKQSLKRLAGSPPNMRDLPHGCSFQARCTFAEQACYDAPPRLNPTSGTDGELRLVACHLYDPTVSMKHEPLAGPGAKGRDDDGFTALRFACSRGAALDEALPVRSGLTERLAGRQPGLRAVNDVSLALHAGSVLALVGESGSGKSTLARVLARLYAPTSGGSCRRRPGIAVVLRARLPPVHQERSTHTSGSLRSRARTTRSATI